VLRVSGLLRSLGAQALNAPPTLRPAARVYARLGADGRRNAAESIVPSIHNMEPSHAAFEIATQSRTSHPGQRSAEMFAPSTQPATRADRVQVDNADRDAAQIAAISPQSRAQPQGTLASAVPSDEQVSAAAPQVRTLRPARTEAAIRGARMENALGARTPLATAELNSEVHIHIGRIELTAVQPSPAPRRERAAQARKSMSLEDYLRGGGKSP
jgi:hypothetical protein